MSEKTIIMDGSNPEKENNERTRILDNENFQKDLLKKSKLQLGKMSKVAGFAAMAAGGFGLGALTMGFMPSGTDEIDPENPVLVPENPQQALGVNDQMSYEDAWQVAREEVGPGGYFVWQGEQFSTYTKEEWDSLDEELQTEFNNNMHEDYEENAEIEENSNVAVVIYERAPVADGVSDDMSFSDAFAMARQEVGPGGIFEWHGKLYATYYKNEWENMDEDDRQDYYASYQHVSINDQTNTTQQNNVVTQTEEEEIPDAEVVNNDSEVFVRDEMVNIEGEEVHVGYFMQGNETIMKLDIDNDNQYDYVVDNETNQLIGLNGNQDVDLDSLAQNTDSDTSDVEAVMSENVQIEGHNALVTLYSDGHQEAKIDMDGDGNYDTALNVSADGKVEMYDNGGNLIAEEQLTPEEIGGDNEYIEEYDGIYGNDDPIASADQDLIDEQLQNEFGNDFDNDIDVSGWMNDDIA